MSDNNNQTCDFCGDNATRRVEHNLFECETEHNNTCHTHFKNILEDFVDGSFIERVRCASLNGYSECYRTITKAQARKELV